MTAGGANAAAGAAGAGSQVLVAQWLSAGSGGGTQLEMGQGMSTHPLVRHLALVVVLKLVALAALWWWFVRDHRVAAGPEQTAAHLAAPAPGARR